MFLPIIALLYTFLTIITAQDLTSFDYYQNRGSHDVGRYVIQGGLEHYSIMWYPSNPTETVQCFVFCMGTGAVPEDYTPTGEHLASHGFAAIYVPMRPWDVTQGLNYCRDGTITKDVKELSSWVNATRMAVGGHSGGGPYAVHAAVGQADVTAIITQHGASIPILNRQSDQDMANLKGDLLVLCGTTDKMPFCGCREGERDYYNRAPLGRAIAKVPDGHVDGACFESGEENESGYITAMLYYKLREVNAAATAIAEGKKGDEVKVDF